MEEKKVCGVFFGARLRTAAHLISVSQRRLSKKDPIVSSSSNPCFNPEFIRQHVLHTNFPFSLSHGALVAQLHLVLVSD